MDPSLPLEESVNTHMKYNTLEMWQCKVKYPKLDNLVQIVTQLGPTALLHMIDLQRAHRNLKIDHYDYPALGLCWCDITHVNIVVPFGEKQGALGCQFFTDTL